MSTPSQADLALRLLCLVLLLACAGCGPAAREPEAPPGRPNFLVIVADDLGVTDVGVYGHELFVGRTPNIDRLGREGLVFERFWSMPSCSPTRAALLTGEYPSRNGIGAVVNKDFEGITDVPEGQRRAGLRDTAFTLPRALASAGYTSAIAGKWHLALPEQGTDHPLRLGFAHHRGAFGNLYPGYSIWRKLVDGEEEMVGVYATTDTTNEAIALAEELAEPWLIVVSYNAPHAFAHVPPAELHGYGEFDPGQEPVRAFQAMVEAMDSEIGRLLTATATHDPVTVFLGDNGTPAWAVDDPRRQKTSKGTVYEGGIHVPLIVTHSSIAAPGRRVAGLAVVTDVFATLVELSGAGVAPERMPADSLSLAPYLRSPATPPLREWVFAESFWPNGFGEKWRHERAARDERYKLIRRGKKSREFYDLLEDPEETTHLRAPSPEAAEAWVRLQKVLAGPPGVREGAR